MHFQLRQTSAPDLDFVLAAEADPDASPFVIRWSREQHEHALTDPDQAHLLVTDAADPLGFVLLAGLASEHHSIELRRIIVARKGQRLGRRALSLVLDHTFGTLAAHRVWLDVKVHNQRARRAYTAVGFIDEGVLRDALLTNGTYESLAVMSVLDHEWTNRNNCVQ
jgi:diamine N-acetyltransferase